MVFIEIAHNRLRGEKKNWPWVSGWVGLGRLRALLRIGFGAGTAEDSVSLMLVATTIGCGWSCCCWWGRRVFEEGGGNPSNRSSAISFSPYFFFALGKSAFKLVKTWNKNTDAAYMSFSASAPSLSPLPPIKYPSCGWFGKIWKLNYIHIFFLNTIN